MPLGRGSAKDAPAAATAAAVATLIAANEAQQSAAAAMAALEKREAALAKQKKKLDAAAALVAEADAEHERRTRFVAASTRAHAAHLLAHAATSCGTAPPFR